MQTKIYLIRHGEVDNPNKIIYGRLPRFGLTEKGKKQLAKTAAALKDKHIDAIYASPLLRARQSAEIIKEHLGLTTLHISEQIIEVRSSYQGRKFSELDELQSEVYLKPLSPSDETIEQIADRMFHFISELITNHTEEHFVVVSHGDPIMALKARIKNKPLTFFSFKTDHYVKHAEVYQISEDGGNFSIKSIFTPLIL